MKALKIAKIIDFVVLLFGWSFMLLAGYCLYSGDTISGLFDSVMAFALVAKVKGTPKFHFVVNEYTSEKSGKKYLGAKFTKEAWAGISLVKKAVLRTNALVNYNFKEQCWLIDRSLGTVDLAEATINSLLLDAKKEKEGNLNEYELKTYERMKEKEANKGQRTKKGGVSAVEAKIQALKDMHKEGLITADQLADKIAGIA